MSEQPPGPEDRDGPPEPRGGAEQPQGESGQQGPAHAGEQLPPAQSEKRPENELSGDSSHSRRQVMKIGGVAGLFAAVGGVFLYTDESEESPPATTTTPDGVPQNAEFVAYGNAKTLLTESAFQDAVESEIEVQGIGIEFSETLDAVEETTGIDPREIEQTTAFGAATATDETYAAMIFETDADAGGVRDSLAEDNLLLGESEYKGYDLYFVGDERSVWDLYLCDLGSDEFALGTQEEVEDIIDIREGDAPGMSDDLRRAVGSTGAGVLQFGFVIPEDPFESLGLPAGANQLVDLEKFEYGYGSVDDLSTGTLVLTLEASTASAAEDFGRQLRGLAEVLDASADSDVLDLPSKIDDQLIDVFREMEVETDGSTVTATLPDGFGSAAIVIAFLLGASRRRT